MRLLTEMELSVVAGGSVAALDHRSDPNSLVPPTPGHISSPMDNIIRWDEDSSSSSSNNKDKDGWKCAMDTLNGAAAGAAAGGAVGAAVGAAGGSLAPGVGTAAGAAGGAVVGGAGGAVAGGVIGHNASDHC